MPRRRKPPGPTNQGGYQGAGNPGGGAATQPAAAPTGLPYGEHQALVQSQQQIPLPAAPSGPSPASAGGGGGAPNPLQAALQAAMAANPPSSDGNGGLLRPSERMSEPVTHGLPSGPGGGPEVLGPMTPTLADNLESIARDTNDPAMARLADLARTLGGNRQAST